MAAFSFCLLPFLNDLLPVSDSVMHDKADFFVRRKSDRICSETTMFHDEIYYNANERKSLPSPAEIFLFFIIRNLAT